MASVKVAARVRPLNAREENLNSEVIIDISGKTVAVTNLKVPDHTVGDQNREKSKVFMFDYCYWSVNKTDSHYVSQEQVFHDLGVDIIDSAFHGYNACVFAYGQTGSGKTYTMSGNPGDLGLTPRISNGLFQRMTDDTKTYRTEVSYFEIYNEAVRDLLPRNASKVNQMLRVREHPKDGPYVEDLSHHIVTSSADIKDLIDLGNERRTTAATNMNDVSSRSHAIFTVVFTQASFSKDSPSETISKIRLVDLAGSERADATGNTGIRLKEGGSINKSLVTLGNVISALADMCESTNPKKGTYIPYRDSVLTWLLKDSLGGNSKTVMIATVSPAACNYGETISTLRYANRAKNIINKPTVNEDPNVKLIRELRAEITRLRMLLGGNGDEISVIQEKLSKSEARVKILTDEWTKRWMEAEAILKEGTTLALRKEGLGVVLDSELPHLIGIDDDLFSSGIILYHLKEGQTTIGTEVMENKQDIVLQGSDVQSEHCVICNENNEVSLVPMSDAECIVNGVTVTSPVLLSQGDVIVLGKSNMFRFNHPAQASKLRQEFKDSNISRSRTSMLSQSMFDLYRSVENLSASSPGIDNEQLHKEQMEALEKKRREVEEMEEKFHLAECDRQKRHMAQEQELERKRQLLLEMQKEAEKMKKEAEEMQKQAREVSEPKQTRADFENRLLDYQQLGVTDNKELNRIEQSIQLLKKLRSDFNFFESISDLDDSVQSRIQIEIQQMDRLLARLAELKFTASDQREKEKNEILSQNSSALADLDSQINEMLAAEEKLKDEIDLFLKNHEGEEPGEKAHLTKLENSVSNMLNSRMELVMKRDKSQMQLLKQFEDLDRVNEDLVKQVDEAVKEVSEHEAVYENLIVEVLKLNESKRENLIQLMRGIRIADGNRESSEERQSGVRQADNGNFFEKPNGNLINELQAKDDCTPSADVEDTSNSCDILPEQMHCEDSANSTKPNEPMSEEQFSVKSEHDCSTPQSEIFVAREDSPHEEQPSVGPGLDLEQTEGKTVHETSSSRKSRNNSETGDNNQSTCGNSFTDTASIGSSNLENFPVVAEFLQQASVAARINNTSSSSDKPFRIRIPSSVYRGSGFKTHVEFEVKVTVCDEEWTILRRYRRFHQLHGDLVSRYPKISCLAFPPKRLFLTDKIIESRRIQLEHYLQKLLEVLYTTPDCPLHPSHGSVFSKQLLCNFHQFFHKGLFETTKHSSC